MQQIRGSPAGQEKKLRGTVGGEEVFAGDPSVAGRFFLNLAGTLPIIYHDAASHRRHEPWNAQFNDLA